MSDLHHDLVIAIGNARVRWTEYVEDCNPIDELDEHGRTLDAALADAALRVPGIRRALARDAWIEAEVDQSMSNAPHLLSWVKGYNEALRRVRVDTAVGGIPVSPSCDD